MENAKACEQVRIVSDAVVGAGMVLRIGQVIFADRLGTHLEGLLRCGAVEPVEDASPIVTLR
jgi:HD-like signal output (HDOD) protein